MIVENKTNYYPIIIMSRINYLVCINLIQPELDNLMKISLI